MDLRPLLLLYREQSSDLTRRILLQFLIPDHQEGQGKQDSRNALSMVGPCTRHSLGLGLALSLRLGSLSKASSH